MHLQQHQNSRNFPLFLLVTVYNINIVEGTCIWEMCVLPKAASPSQFLNKLWSNNIATEAKYYNT